jgi:hypothetical protein
LWNLRPPPPQTDSPIDALQQLTQAIVDAQENILANTGPGDPAAGVLRVNRNVHARFGYMPHGVAEHNRTNISGIRSSDVGLFLQVTGTVIRTGTVRALCRTKRHALCYLLQDFAPLHAAPTPNYLLHERCCMVSSVLLPFTTSALLPPSLHHPTTPPFAWIDM